MPKAINWPPQFYNEIMSEDDFNNRIALRLGTLYYDNQYYNPNEVIDIRVDHKITRQGIIVGLSYLKTIDELNETEISLYKNDLETKDKIVEYLGKTYNQKVGLDTTVTVIKYKNLPLQQIDGHDDPHMC